MDNNQFKNITPNTKIGATEENSIDIKAWFFKLLSYWYLFVIGAFIALLVGFVYNLFTPRVYQASTTVLIKDRESSAIDPTALMTNLNVFGRTGQNRSNEIGIMKSYMMTDRTVKLLGLEVTYYDLNHIVTNEMYKTSPFEVEVDYNIPQVVNVKYDIVILNNNEFSLKAKGDGYLFYDYLLEQRVSKHEGEFSIPIVTYRFGEWVDNGINKFRVVLTDQYQPEYNDNEKFAFVLRDYTTLVRSMRNFSATPLDKESSIVTLTMQGRNPRKIVDFLNTLTQEYVKRGLEMKNKVSENTILFIDQQLVEIEDSLSFAEKQLQDFRSNAVVMDLNSEASQTYKYLKEVEKSKAELELQLKYYNNIRSYVLGKMDQLDKLIAPSAMGIADPLLNRLVQELVDLSAQRSQQLLTSTEKNPSVLAIDERIVSTKHSLVENINNMIANTELSVQSLDLQIQNLEGQVKTLPATQRELVNYQRQFDLNNEIYTYLMQKRSEAQIVKASNTPDNEVLDIARTTLAVIVAPRRAINYLIALILGLGLPFLYVVLKLTLTNKIMEKKDIEKLCDNSIIGQIPLSTNKSTSIVIDSPKSSISEAFRGIRTNNSFLTQGKEKSVILVTGDSPGLGKTFISINLASIYALYGKKTVLLGFDLRKPRIFQAFQLTNKVGVTDYLCNKAGLSDIINSSVKLDCLDVITSGKVPPNPAELIASDRCTELFNELKEQYDYIIIDTPPVGLVTDAVLLMKYSDINLFIVRQEVSNKHMFESIINDLNNRGLKINLIINGIRFDKGYGYRYSYGYGGYGYGYGYGTYRHYGSYGGGHGYYGEDDNTEHHHHHHHKKSLMSKLFGRKH